MICILIEQSWIEQHAVLLVPINDPHPARWMKYSGLCMDYFMI